MYYFKRVTALQHLKRSDDVVELMPSSCPAGPCASMFVWQQGIDSMQRGCGLNQPLMKALPVVVLFLDESECSYSPA
eukprot:828299-Pyramimonas_sp.AAC.1